MRRGTSCSSNGTFRVSHRRPSRTRGAAEVLDGAVALMNDAGVRRQGDVDCLVAVTAGLIDAQLSNDPGGSRWTRHLNRLIDLLVDDAITRSTANEH